jgi:hypothetical protein
MYRLPGHRKMHQSLSVALLSPQARGVGLKRSQAGQSCPVFHREFRPTEGHARQPLV